MHPVIVHEPSLDAQSVTLSRSSGWLARPGRGTPVNGCQLPRVLHPREGIRDVICWQPPDSKIARQLFEGFDVEKTVDLSNGISQRRPVTAPPVIEISVEGLLVNAARDGDRAAFGHLYARYARMVHGILLARVPPEEVDDLVQDVFLLALRRLHMLRDTAAFGSWLGMIARNRANDYHRRSKEIARLSQGVAEDLAGETPAAAEALAVLSVIRTLPDAYRETLILRLVEGMTGPEIAARTGLTPASVRVNLHRGMKQLREKLGRSDAHE